MTIFSCCLVSALHMVFPTICCSYVLFNILFLNTTVICIYLSNLLVNLAADLLVGKSGMLNEFLFLPITLTQL